MVTALSSGRSRSLIDRLADLESPAFTARRARRREASGADQDPIVWCSAHGVNVVDADGNRYVDFTSGFGVVAVGHAHPRVRSAIQEQSERLIHGLGDVHPSEPKIDLLERLNQMVPGNTRTALSVTGSDAVATALKTAALHTKKTSLIAFEGAYHGLAYGPLAVCGYNPNFRLPFEPQLNPQVRFLPFPGDDGGEPVFRELEEDPPGAIIIEPMLGRGGIRELPSGFLAKLSDACKRSGTLLIVDEIFTGLGRTGTALLSLEMGADPDLVCVGKALGGGMPISACIGKESVMRAWGDPNGEALHTGTFFGHPLSCAAALATLELLDGGLIGRAASLGAYFREKLETETSLRVRGRGLALAVELSSSAVVFQTLRALLERGYLALPAGNDAIGLTPPLTIETDLLDGFCVALKEAVRD